MQQYISFVLDGALVNLDCAGQDIRPTTTVLNYLRSLPTHQGTKRGCDEGDCGACTVVLGSPTPEGTIRYTAVASCLLFLPMLHGKQLITVENLKNSRGDLHPVQKAMVDSHGSQCGFCTPGIVMSLFGLYKSSADPGREEIAHALTGNLCRCTGYDQIIDAAGQMHANNGNDHFVTQAPEIVKLLKAIPKKSVHLNGATQQYFLPASLEDALAILKKHPAAVIVNGGTDVALRVTKRYESLATVIDLSHVDALQAIRESDDAIEFGAGVHLQDIFVQARQSLPALHAMLNVFGSQQIRSLATLGGNVGTASPIGDTPPVLMAHKARVVLQCAEGRRELPMNEFITGYRTTARRPDELITSFIIPKPPSNVVIRAYKVSKRRDFDISTVSGCFRLDLDEQGCVKEIILAYGGMAAFTKRAAATETFLTGKQWTRETIAEALPLVETDFQPISDVRAGAAMRQIAARNLLLKFWAESRSREAVHA